MNNYETWKALKNEQHEAARWAGKLGAKSNATAPHLGTIASAEGKLCIHYQPSDGATNYHDSPKAFNACLAEVMKKNAKQLIEEALHLMQERTIAALIACESELATLQKEISDSKLLSETQTK